MNSQPDKHHRRSIRLRGYDYSRSGAYFITTCAERRLCLFGEIKNGELQCNAAGEMLAQQWLAIIERFPQAILDQWIVMPNHFHGIIVIGEEFGATTRVDPTITPVELGDIVGAWKSLTTNAYIAGVRNQDWSPFPKRLWQRNYYEHIIRNERELDAIREYIFLNPTRWQDDRENPKNPLPPKHGDNP